MDESQVIDALGALAQETRLRILRFLVTKGSDGASAGEIGEAVDAASSRASFHLSTLANAGLVTAERKSRHIIYRVNFDAVGGMIGYLINDCCGNHQAVIACCQIPGKC
ncbi:ArsR/SmtB family transcription factor [Parasedimentitalea huanghaiensis]|uniref:Metalloregulator ArsR/SmtB family transcription factor n=1 Tax=Parasedimentitalea huanghaiensis TaxID=2682100 RepID=A0A6L6WIC1_9RHOB|nr:metalloregulator ArsR/SmtB family transcription factor [Zongyanglinia huanghaiensis]MVO15472.1 metalloregulator ArsR/SmtB family transcription factor [Zongyanglinia huanghaiensis]